MKEKIKVLIGVLNNFNDNKDLLLASTSDKEDENANYTNIFNLICCLEDEIGKLLEPRIIN